MRAKEFITELFDKPLPYKWTDQSISKLGDCKWIGEFHTNDNKILGYIEFLYDKDDNKASIAFTVNGRFAISGEGHAIEIFSTVAKMFDEFLMSTHPLHIHFSANANEQSRIKLYDRFSKLISKKYGYILSKNITNIEVDYELSKI